MKFLLPLLTAVAFTQAATPVNRQASPSASVRAAIQLVIDDAGALQTAVQGLNTIDQLASVQSAISKLQDDINAGASTFSGLSALSDTDALGLANLVAPLQSATSDAVDAVIAKKQVIVNLCVGPVAYQAFQNLIPAAQTFATNLRGLVSTTFQGIIDSASNNIQASLQRGLAAYQDAQTPPASCSSSTTGGPTTGPTTTGGGPGPTTTGGEPGTTTTGGTPPTTTPGNTCQCPPPTTTTGISTTSVEVSTTTVVVTTTPVTSEPVVTTPSGCPTLPYRPRGYPRDDM